MHHGRLEHTAEKQVPEEQLNAPWPICSPDVSVRKMVPISYSLGAFSRTETIGMAAYVLHVTFQKRMYTLKSSVSRTELNLAAILKLQHLKTDLYHQKY